MPLSQQLKNQHLLWRAGFGIDMKNINFLNATKPKDLFLALVKSNSNKIEYFDLADNSIKGIFMGIGDAIKIQQLTKNGIDSETKKKIRQQSREDRTANNMFLIGGGLKRKGILNALPNLSDLQDGDLKYNVDFKNLYATILNKWLGANDKLILNKKFDYMNFV